MRSSHTARSPFARLFLGAALLVGIAGSGALAQATKDTTPRFDIYGFGQGDFIIDFKRNNPQWFDVNRPSKLPSNPNEFGEDGHSYLSPRQSRFGVKATFPTRRGDVFANFDFDMFGVGADAGQTTIRLRHAYGTWHDFGGGLLESTFMDIDVFPNILEYWGPNGMMFFRNTQLFWQPVHGKKDTLKISIENPGASADAGNFANRIELSNVFPRYPLPDFAAAYKLGTSWGYVRAAGIVRDIRWDQVPTDTFDLSGHVTGWGFNVSSNVKFLGKDVIRLQFTYGAGIENYFNDAPIDVGVESNFPNRRTPITGKALPAFGASTYLDHYWNPRVTTAIGWSMVNITNSDLQTPQAYHNGQYASVNLLWTPVTNVLMGGEFQYGRRLNNSDGFSFDDYRLQFSFKYSFSQHFGGQ